MRRTRPVALIWWCGEDCNHMEPRLRVGSKVVWVGRRYTDPNWEEYGEMVTELEEEAAECQAELPEIL